MTDINKMYYYQGILKNLREEKLKSVKAYESIIDILKVSKAKIRNKLAKNFKQAQNGTKKNAGIEILELWTVNSFPELEEDYNNYIKYSQEEKSLTKIIDSYNSDISSIQSEMKFYPPEYGVINDK